jgi:hypothetical protein
VPNTTAAIATDSDTAIASQQAISAEMATIASDYLRAGVEETQVRMDYPPYRSSLLRHPTKDLHDADPEGVELWTPCFSERVNPLEADVTIQHRGEPIGELTATPAQTIGPFFGYALPFDRGNELVPPGSPNALHAAGAERRAGTLLGAVFNPGGSPTPRSILQDAMTGVELPVVDVHNSNVHKREPFRHHSYVSPAATGIIVSLGTAGYEWAIRALVGKEV